MHILISKFILNLLRGYLLLTLLMLKHTLILSILIASTALAEPPSTATPSADKPLYLTSTPTWMHLSIVSQNAGHKIHMLGVDADEVSKKSFAKDIATIDTLLNQLVAKGLLKKQTFHLKPQLDLDESLIMAVGEFAEKASEKYGIYVVREMMDVGTRQRLKPFDDQAPVVLNVRMPAKLLKELKVLMLKNGVSK